LNNLTKPQYLGNTQLVLDGKVYNLQEYGKVDSLQILETVQQVVSSNNVNRLPGVPASRIKTSSSNFIGLGFL